MRIRSRIGGFLVKVSQIRNFCCNLQIYSASTRIDNRANELMTRKLEEASRVYAITSSLQNVKRISTALLTWSSNSLTKTISNNLHY